MEEAIASDVYRDLSTARLSTGDPAHPFELPRLDAADGIARETGETARLADHVGVPVALVFGSYT